MKRLFGFNRLPAPEFCPDCGHKLGPLQYGKKYDERGWQLLSPPKIMSGETYRFCDCGCYVQWSFLGGGHQGWKRHHVMTLFDDGKIVLLVD